MLLQHALSIAIQVCMVASLRPAGIDAEAVTSKASPAGESLQQVSSGAVRAESTSFDRVLQDYGVAQGKCTLPPSLYVGPNAKIDSLFLANETPFTYTRWGDGEWMAAMDWGVSSNSDGVQLNDPALVQDIHDSMEKMKSFGPNFVSVVGTFFLCEENHHAINAAVGSFMDKHRDFRKFRDGFYCGVKKVLQTIRHREAPLNCQDEESEPNRRPVAMIAKNVMRKLQHYLRYDYFIEVPESVAFKDRDRILQNMLDISAKHQNEHVYFLLSLGPSKIGVLTRAYEKIGQKDTLIDIGSQLDGNVGNVIRDYIDIPKLCKGEACHMADGVCDSEQ